MQEIARRLPNPEHVNAFLRMYWRIVDDPFYAEYIRAPLLQLEFWAAKGFLPGDCDDAATLAGALVVATGWPAFFMAIRLPRMPEFSHVFLRVPIMFGFLDIDPIVPAEHLPITGYAEALEVWI